MLKQTQRSFFSVAERTPIDGTTLHNGRAFEEHPQIPGLLIMRNAISRETDDKLMRCIDRAAMWDGGWLKRRTQHYGYQYLYDSRTIGKPMPIPRFVRRARWYIERLILRYTKLPLKQTPCAADDESRDWSARFPSHFNQAIVNEYMPGQGIGRHTDQPQLFENAIAILCLGSDTTMIFRIGALEVPVRLERGMLVLMTGESRYSATHEIEPRKSDNVDGRIIPRMRRNSLTFRRSLPGVVEAASEETNDRE
jgi:alkylated DNA repair dioxygenase AlkB